ncbi:MAG: hypothetical protein HN390_07485 [Anaerolineae bacterium]|jgi:hypothetical protein|nr:hypothetical protein [Anaerolineae bacterium]MBT7189552.1 hypothetical protein [Anaerolineae bacterium]MBT7992111.1 hypothetical protein [Anaerolineae bacterium]
MQGYKQKDTIECTIGVIHIPGGILFFKNRDLNRDYLRNRLTVFQSTPEAHSLKGANLQTMELEGISIGINKHRVCVANTHVLSSEDVTYDILCERILSQVKEKTDIPKVTNEFMGENSVQGGRILIASPEWTYLLEVYQKEFQLQEITGNIAITNNFSLIDHQTERPKIREESSLKRLEVASLMIKGISNIGMLKGMLRSHLPEKGELSICNHQAEGGGTESSHIIQIQGDYVGWSSLLGHPCENDYQTTLLFQ